MYFFFHFGWLRKKNTQKKHIRIIPFFLLPSVTPPIFFLSAKNDQELSPNFALHLGRMKHFQGDASLRSSGWECRFRGRWKSFGWPGGRLQQDVHGVFSLSGWYFWRFIACIFSGWNVHWLMYFKKSSQIYSITGHIYQWDISRNLDIFFRKQPELQPGSLCERLVRFGDVLTKKNGCFSRSLWVQVCCFLL